APSVSIAIQVARKMVIRAGSRLSYQSFSLNNTETILRNAGGAAQTILSIAFPTYVAGQAPPEIVMAHSLNAGSIYVRSSSLEAPYNVNSLASLEPALPGGVEIGRQRGYQSWGPPDPNAQYQRALARHSFA